MIKNLKVIFTATILIGLASCNGGGRAISPSSPFSPSSSPSPSSASLTLTWGNQGGTSGTCSIAEPTWSTDQLVKLKKGMTEAEIREQVEVTGVFQNDQGLFLALEKTEIPQEVATLVLDPTLKEAMITISDPNNKDGYCSWNYSF
jgi:hypothetical protein